MSYLAEALLNEVLCGVNFTPPAQLWLALLTSAGEVVGAGYGRVNVTSGFSTASADDISTNLSQISFPTPIEPWGTVISAAVYDAQTGGNLLFVAKQMEPRNIPAGTPVYYNAGAIKVSIRAAT